MTKPLKKAVEIIIDSLKKPKKVLEIGSRQEKNQKKMADLRSLFDKSVEYVGVDMRAGPGVDVVANANKLPFKDKEFDLVFCLETLEHADKPWLIAGEIERVVKGNGVVVISSQQNFPIHMHPSDYFRYTPYGLSVLFNQLKSRLIFSISPPFDNEVKLNPQNVVLVGSKSRNDVLMRKIQKNIIKAKNEISVHKPYRHRIKDGWKMVKRGISELGYREEVEFFRK